MSTHRLLYPKLGYMSRVITMLTMGKRNKIANLTQQQRLQALLRQIRLEAKLRQVDLANRLGQPQSFVSKYESGERRLDVLELRRICEALGTSLVAFVRRLEDSFSESQGHETK